MFKHTATLLIALFLSILTGSSPQAAKFIEGFEDSNIGNWKISGYDVLETTGGNPLAYRHVQGLDTFIPSARTFSAEPNIFNGNYRTKQVTELGIDIILHQIGYSADGRPLSLALIHDGGTPFDYTDDWAAVKVGDTNIPLPGEGWLRYRFDVPCNATELPADWITISLGVDAPVDPDWNALITDVGFVAFYFGDPQLYFINQYWNTGMDNPYIVFQDIVSTETADWSRIKALY
ncbi:MAG: hypothetical protein GY835_04170 [bacterium]|nr:hypothetical protein [bacterium]